MPACFLLMFYAWTSQKYLLVMMFMALINYMGALWVEHFRNSTDTLYAYEPFSTNELKMINNENDFVEMNGEAVLNQWFSTNFNVEVHAYVKNKKYCVVNNTYEPQDTTVYVGDGSSFELHLDSNEIKWYQI